MRYASRALPARRPTPDTGRNTGTLYSKGYAYAAVPIFFLLMCTRAIVMTHTPRAWLIDAVRIIPDTLLGMGEGTGEGMGEGTGDGEGTGEGVDEGTGEG